MSVCTGAFPPAAAGLLDGLRATMRPAFLRRLGVPPDQYRRHFATLEETP